MPRPTPLSWKGGPSDWHPLQRSLQTSPAASSSFVCRLAPPASPWPTLSRLQRPLPPPTTAPAHPCLWDDPWPPHTQVGAPREPEAPVGELQGCMRAQSMPDTGPAPSRQPPRAGLADAVPSRLQRRMLACPPWRRAADLGGRCRPAGVPAASGHVCNQGGAAAASRHTRHSRPGVGSPQTWGTGVSTHRDPPPSTPRREPLQPQGQSPVLPSLPSPLAAVAAASSLEEEGGSAQPPRAACSSWREVPERRLSIHAHDLSSYPCLKLQAVKGQGDIWGSWCEPGAESSVSLISSHLPSNPATCVLSRAPVSQGTDASHGHVTQSGFGDSEIRLQP